MKQFTLSLYENFQRPVAALNNWYNFDVMIDTGALFPIWTDDEEMLHSIGADLIRTNVSFGGFGGKAEGNLYRLQCFVLGELMFPRLPIIACKANIPCHMIVSATMFSNLRYEIDDENHKLNVTIPSNQSLVRNLKIIDKNGDMQILCISKNLNSGVSPCNAFR